MNMLNSLTLVVVTLTFASTSVFSNGKVIRLSLGLSENSSKGAVLISEDGQKPFFICDRLWDTRNSKVMCRSLGFSNFVYFESDGRKLDGSDPPLWLWHFQCLGNEKNVTACHTKAVTQKEQKNCTKVILTCAEVSQQTTDDPAINNAEYFDIDWRLDQLRNIRINSTEYITGVLQHNTGDISGWTSVCTTSWGYSENFVACGHLGYPDTLPNSNDSDWTLQFSNHQMTYNIIEMNCSGRESNLNHCKFKQPPINPLQSCQIVSLTCRKLSKTIESTVRLRAGFHPSEGRAEVYVDNQWQTICDDGWDLNDANVLCRQLGYGTAVEAFHWATYGEGVIPIGMTDVQCNGEEDQIQNCQFSIPKNCSHKKDASVRCTTPQIEIDQDVRLVGGKTEYKGRIEVRRFGKWFGVCGVNFGFTEASVVCRQLGLGFAMSATRSSKYGINREILLYNVRCNGNEDDLFECKRNAWFTGRCRYYDMATITCGRVDLPDLLMDAVELEESIRVETHLMSELRCSREERCLSKSAYDYDAYRNPKKKVRTLLKFTARIQNKGTANFYPDRKRSSWEWHQCHKHYHSMERFADYDLRDLSGLKIAEGHKPSYCLEDTDCDDGAKAIFKCENGGEQAVSPGCADNYKYTLDCQWVDVTDVKYGNYTLEINVNPLKTMGESDFSNNKGTCRIEYYDGDVDVKSCTSDPCYQKTHGGNGYSMCCHFPFEYQGQLHYNCISNSDDPKNSAWCSVTRNFDIDRLWGYC